MGHSAKILQKRENVNLNKAIEDIKLAAKRANLEIMLGRVEKCVFGEGYCTTVNVAKNFYLSDDEPEEPQLLMYVNSQGQNNYPEEFDWICKGAHLAESIYIDRITEREKILLLFLYEYMSINPDVFFYDSCEWAYSYADVVKIKNQEYDDSWCYKKPQ